MKEQLKGGTIVGNVASYGVNQKENNRIIDSDDDCETLEDGTLLNQVKGGISSTHTQNCDNYLRLKSALNDSIFNLINALTKT